jgi:hypothetical protein
MYNRNNRYTTFQKEKYKGSSGSYGKNRQPGLLNPTLANAGILFSKLLAGMTSRGQ